MNAGWNIADVEPIPDDRLRNLAAVIRQMEIPDLSVLTEVNPNAAAAPSLGLEGNRDCSGGLKRRLERNSAEGLRSSVAEVGLYFSLYRALIDSHGQLFPGEDVLK